MSVPVVERATARDGRRHPQSTPMFGAQCEADETGLTIRGDVDFAEWVAVGRKIMRVWNASAWWIGDWLVYGEFRYGEKYSTVVETLQLKYDRLRDYAYVAGNTPRSVRRPDVSFSHHRIVAKLEPAEQARWLEEAAGGSWTTRQLKEAVACRTLQRGDPDRAELRLAVQRRRIEVWQEAAQRDGMELESWIAEALDHAATMLFVPFYPESAAPTPGRRSGTRVPLEYVSPLLGA